MKYIIALILNLFISKIIAQPDSLRLEIDQLIKTKKALVGVSIFNLKTKDTLNINSTLHFPMMSVFKFHIALAVLNEVDKGKLFLNQKIKIKSSDLLPDTWSPLREEYIKKRRQFTLAEIIYYTVALSDNNGCDILLRLLGDAYVVHNYIKNIGISNVSIKANEEAMQKNWDAQYLNWTTTIAAMDLMKLFYEKKIVSEKSFNFLYQTMLETNTGLKRLKGQLPSGTSVAHKTGTSDTSKDGLTIAVNDIGIVTLPNGNCYFIAVFVSNSRENMETNEKIISDISKLAWDYFSNL